MSSYRYKYVKIYFWKTIAVLLGFISIFVVIPYMSSDKTLYGIYSVCTSLTIFFTYADLGFLSSGAKYAAEYYINGDYKSEIKVIGFTAFFMAIIFIIVDLIVLFLAIKPQILIPELIVDSEQYIIAKKLLFLLAAGCPCIICQRVLQVIYIVRVEEYKFQRILICGNIFRILSILFFFGSGSYNIIGYYFFYQIVNLLINLVALCDIKKYGYKYRDFIQSFKFDKQIFSQEKALSLSSFVFMISMILYNELDQVVISNMFGVKIVSVYAIAFSIMTYMRTYSGVIYSPFIARFNHFTGLRDYKGLIHFSKKIIIVLGPILIIPLLNVALYADAFVVSWVGDEYISSAMLISWMVLSYTTNFITTPLTSYMTAMEKNNKILVGAILLPVIYWCGILFLSEFIGYKSFAIMKFIGPLILVCYYWTVIKNDIKSAKVEFVKLNELFLSLMPPIIISVVLAFAIRPLLRYSHDVYSLIYNVCFIILGIVISLVFAVIFNRDLREVIVYCLKSIKHKMFSL